MEQAEHERQGAGEAASGNGAPSDTTVGGQMYRRVHYTADTFTDLINELYVEYPDQWIAIAVLEETPGEDPAFTGELIAHSPFAGAVSQAIKAYAESHTALAVSFFSTELATVRRRRR